MYGCLYIYLHTVLLHFTEEFVPKESARQKSLNDTGIVLQYYSTTGRYFTFLIRRIRCLPLSKGNSGVWLGGGYKF